MNDLIYWVWLSEKCNPDTPAFSILYHTFGSAKSIYDATEDELKSVFGITEKAVMRLTDKSTDKAYEIIKTCQMSNIGILTYGDELFPSRLRTIKNPPVLLYYKGRLPEFDKEVCIGTVGTRNPTSYGCRCAYEIAFDLASCGAYVVSGMAFGIDSVCHGAALDAGGNTVAILGCGVDVVYPKENADLYARLCLNGTIMSEYPPGFKATRYSFPQRNRIISGLSLGTMIVEAQLKSGAMITAKTAKEQNRDLFAVPGRVGEFNSLGPNSLIHDGAISVSNAYDILKEYEFLYPDKIRPATNNDPKNNPYALSGEQINFKHKKKSAGTKNKAPEAPIAPELTDEENEALYAHLPEEQRAICRCLSKNDPVSLEEIVGFTKISVSDTMSSLTIMEIQGIVKAVPGGSFLLV